MSYTLTMETIKKPNLNAPRFRPNRYNVMDEKLFRGFRKKFPQFKDIPDKKLREIIARFNTMMWETAISNRDGIEFPEGLGYTFVGSCPSPKVPNVDYSTSAKLGVRVEHRNMATDNFMAKIFYTNFANKYRFQNRELWMFRAHRDFSRAVSAAYPENFKMYVQVDSFKNISDIFKAASTKAWIKTEAPLIEQPEDYNEFKMD